MRGSGPDRSYVEELGEWIIEEGARPSQQTIAFEWRRDGETSVVEQCCNDAQKLGARVPAELSSPDGLWCSTALEELASAAKAFTETHGPSILEEFGLPSQRVYAYHDDLPFRSLPVLVLLAAAAALLLPRRSAGDCLRLATQTIVSPGATKSNLLSVDGSDLWGSSGPTTLRGSILSRGNEVKLFICGRL